MPLFNKFATSNKSKKNINVVLISIVENVNNILNTKKGFGYVMPEYGIDDINKYTATKFLVNAFVDDLKKNIDKFEPRLKIVNLEFVKKKDPFTISFKLVCIISENTNSLEIVFDTFFNKFRVKGC